MPPRLLTPFLLVLIAAAPASRPASRPTTRPAAWHAALQPFRDPAPPEDPLGYDPADAYVESLGPRFNPAKREEAFTLLLTTNTFTFRLVDAGGNRSRHSQAFETLYSQPDAKEIFKDLLDRGTTAGQLYALAALKQLDRPTYDRRIEAYRQSKSTVWTHGGCLILKHRVADLAEEIVDGPIRPAKL